MPGTKQRPDCKRPRRVPILMAFVTERKSFIPAIAPVGSSARFAIRLVTTMIGQDTGGVRTVKHDKRHHCQPVGWASLPPFSLGLVGVLYGAIGGFLLTGRSCRGAALLGLGALAAACSLQARCGSVGARARGQS